MRKALVVGIDHYEQLSPLSGCVNDARRIHGLLERNFDQSINFATPKLMLGNRFGNVTKRAFKEAVSELFANEDEIALLYFAGHSYLENSSLSLCLSDTEPGENGYALSEILYTANSSEAKNKIIILDSCHSGAAGNHPFMEELTEIFKGVTILAASRPGEYAMEEQSTSAGVFTTLLANALDGAAANLLGEVTPGSVYAHIDQSLGPWAQRPVFKTHVEAFVSLRRTQPPIEISDLRTLVELFPSPDYLFELDPSFEPERNGNEDEGIPKPNQLNTQTFSVLQNCARVNLVRPNGAPHMWHAAMQQKACELTLLGKHYWKLVDKGLI